jgi:DNA-binding response OmpR family regulator
MDGFRAIQQLRRGAERDDTVVLMLTSDDLKFRFHACVNWDWTLTS